MCYDEGVAYPILLGNENKIRAIAAENHIDIEELPIIDPRSDEQEEKENNLLKYFLKKDSAAVLINMSRLKIMRDRNHFGCMMVETGEADAMISGLTRNYPDAIRPAIQIIGTEEGVKENCRHVFIIH